MPSSGLPRLYPSAEEVAGFIGRKVRVQIRNEHGDLDSVEGDLRYDTSPIKGLRVGGSEPIPMHHIVSLELLN